MTSTMNNRRCDDAVVRKRSIDSRATLSAVSTPIVISEPGRSLSIVEATPLTAIPSLENCEGSCLRTIAANDDQPLHPSMVERRRRPYPPLPRLEFQTAIAFQHRSAEFNDAGHVPGRQGNEVALDQPRIPAADPQDFVPCSTAVRVAARMAAFMPEHRRHL